MEKEYIFCYTVSGEGYSSPEFKAFSDKEIANGYLSEKLNQVEQQTDGRIKRTNDNDFVIIVGEDEQVEGSGDYHRLQIIEVIAAPYHFIRATEPNEVESPFSHESKVVMTAYMNNCIDCQKWDEGEEGYDSHANSYGAHSDDGYIHYEIVSATQVLVEVLMDEKDEPETKLFQGTLKETALISMLAGYFFMEPLIHQEGMGQAMDILLDASVAFYKEFEPQLKTEGLDWMEFAEKYEDFCTGYDDVVHHWIRNYINEKYSKISI